MDAPLLLRALAATAALGLAAPGWAQERPAPAAAAATGRPIERVERTQAPRPSRPEPAVQHIVIEDDGARIEELRVRGQTTRITVQPKGVSPKLGYEIVPAGGARDMTPHVVPERGTAGQRVWSVLSF